MSVRAEKKNVTGHLELELQMIVNHHVGSGSQS